jgi:hypothetical protein
MIRPTEAYQCRCDKCGHEFLCMMLPARCPNNKCRSRLWNRKHEERVALEAQVAARDLDAEKSNKFFGIEA